MKLPLFIGKAVYIITKPGIYRMLNGSTRVYVLMRVGDEVLVTKNWLGLHKTWRLPGGGLQEQETPLQALKREVHEELGLTIEEKKLKLIHPEAFFEKDKKFSYFLYVLDYLEKPAIMVNEKEIVAAQWIRIDELQKKSRSEELISALNSVK